MFEALKIGDDLLSGRAYFFDHFTAPAALFFWCSPPRHSVGGRHLRLPRRRGAFQAHSVAPERQKLLASPHKKEVNEGFPETA